MNAASGYLDGSDLYGNNDDELHKLRTYSHGKVDLRACVVCTKAKDEPLGLIYRAFLLEHNRLAEKLGELNEHWDDTRVFLEARRAVVAQIQHVTLNEYVPSILGETAYNDPDLSPVTTGCFGGYSSTNRAGTYDAVAFAALQVLTSLKKLNTRGISRLEEHIAASANHVSLDFTNVLGNDEQSEWMPSERIVHEARDHGVPGYVEFISLCSNGTIKVIKFEF